jgi:hypothetical protein
MSSPLVDWPQFWRTTGGPAWRLAWAHSLLPSESVADHVDPLVVQLRRYLLQRDRGNAAAREPLIAAAEKLNECQPLVDGMQVLALAGATPAQIAERLSTQQAVVERWLDLFFDISEVRPATDWLYIYVVEPARQRDPALASRMRVALGGGLAAIDALVAAETKQSQDPEAEHRQRELRLNYRLDQALDRLVQAPQQQVRLVKSWLTAQIARQRLELQRRLRAATLPVTELPTAALLALKWATSSTAVAQSVEAATPQIAPVKPAAVGIHDPRQAAA